MIRTIIIAALALSNISAFAEDAQKFTIAQCNDIGTGLSELNGYSRVVKQGESETTVMQQYRLGKSRTAVALNLLALKPINEGNAAASNTLITEISDGVGMIKPDTPGAIEYRKRYKEDRLDKPCPITFARLSMRDLKPGDPDEKDKNPIPPYVLVLLEPIIDHDEK